MIDVIPFPWSIVGGSSNSMEEPDPANNLALKEWWLHGKFGVAGKSWVELILCMNRLGVVDIATRSGSAEPVGKQQRLGRKQLQRSLNNTLHQPIPALKPESSYLPLAEIGLERHPVTRPEEP
ncbi:retinoblastoma-like protein 1 [Platysternon megacephalum]|uniref:Retinoblastoma-like protein 1 n=1 Tax=Platysternon megacephalum TaxID=55544 RepID=A0A4D9E708_9SAUR|nr:retinoblastoma-like protein 1 [Platysternon megacephalum]